MIKSFFIRHQIAIITLTGALLITSIKFVAFFITSSSAILTDAFESFVNLFTSTFALYSFYLAAKPKDKNHPYGHGKIEFLATGLEGALIVIAGLVVIYQAIYTWIFPEPLLNLDKGMVFIFLSGLLNLGLGYYLVQAGKKTNSLTLTADGKHWLVDTYTSAGLLAGVAIVFFTGQYWLDKVLAIGLGGWIIFSGGKLIRTGIGGLMDEYDRNVLNEIAIILENHRKDFWIDIHNLRIQKYGNSYHVDCHLTMPWYENLQKIHQEMLEVQDLINENMDESVEFFIHPDPCRPQSCPVCKIADCPVRKAPFEKQIPWTVDNLIKTTMHNRKVEDQ